ncbi:unnamed protein product [Moneuplotes crassus]|uniref:Uncharacterized protein n=1 Tax=Euplotes crassus TaxID=5936 RepID=A0AAD1X8K4_EUPCR|nr:unnamed protein product [Moneuplotes crassus]
METLSTEKGKDTFGEKGGALDSVKTEDQHEIIEISDSSDKCTLDQPPTENTQATEDSYPYPCGKNLKVHKTLNFHNHINLTKIWNENKVTSNNYRYCFQPEGNQIPKVINIGYLEWILRIRDEPSILVPFTNRVITTKPPKMGKTSKEEDQAMWPPNEGGPKGILKRRELLIDNEMIVAKVRDDIKKQIQHEQQLRERIEDIRNEEIAQKLEMSPNTKKKVTFSTSAKGGNSEGDLCSENLSDNCAIISDTDDTSSEIGINTTEDESSKDQEMASEDTSKEMASEDTSKESEYESDGQEEIDCDLEIDERYKPDWIDKADKIAENRMRYNAHNAREIKINSNSFIWNRKILKSNIKGRFVAQKSFQQI